MKKTGKILVLFFLLIILGCFFSSIVNAQTEPPNINVFSDKDNYQDNEVITIQVGGQAVNKKISSFLVEMVIDSAEGLQILTKEPLISKSFSDSTVDLFFSKTNSVVEKDGKIIITAFGFNSQGVVLNSPQNFFTVLLRADSKNSLKKTMTIENSSVLEDLSTGVYLTDIKLGSKTFTLNQPGFSSVTSFVSKEVTPTAVYLSPTPYDGPSTVPEDSALKRNFWQKILYFIRKIFKS